MGEAVIACPKCESTEDLTVDWRTCVTARFKDGVTEYVSLGGWTDGGDLMYFHCSACDFTIQSAWGETPVPIDLSDLANETVMQVDHPVASGFENGFCIYDSEAPSNSLRVWRT